MSIDLAALRPLEEAKLFLREEMTEPVRLTLGSGEVVVFSTPRHTAKANEDSAAVLPVGEDRSVLLVADGMGGASAGDLAAQIVVESVASSVADIGLEPSLLRNAILDGIEAANREVMGLDVRAGSTIAAVEIVGNRLRTYHAGDSMVILFGPTGLARWKTVSHSPVGYAVASGFFQEHQAIRHESLHLLSNAVGTASMKLEIGTTAGFEPGDTLLIASDGLFDNLLTREVGELVRGEDLLGSISQMVGIACSRMAEPSAENPSKPDDLTVVAFKPFDQEALGTLSFRASDPAAAPE
jgi:serine/threonine protein phosphatase PrpC